MGGPFQAEMAAMEGALDHMKQEGRTGKEVAIVTDSMSLLGKEKKGVADDEAEARLFSKLGDIGVGGIGFAKSHKGITENGEADRMSDWKWRYDVEEEEGDQQGDNK